MTDDSNAAYWARARAPRYPHARYLQAAYNPLPPEPEAEPEPTETVVKHASEFVDAVSPQPRMLTGEEMTALRLGYGALPHHVPATGLRDPAYQEAQFTAAQQTSLSASPATNATVYKEKKS